MTDQRARLRDAVAAMDASAAENIRRALAEARYRRAIQAGVDAFNAAWVGKSWAGKDADALAAAVKPDLQAAVNAAIREAIRSIEEQP